jgi:adenosylmethionine-8-amino-7-oxononanoate aminotransferase
MIETTTRLWHPFADMSHVAGRELRIVRAEGIWLWDDDGRRYLDATASLWYANIGHGRERMAVAIAEQIRRLDAYSIFGDYSNREAEELAERLAALAPVSDARVFLATGGGDGVETAAKLARLYWARCGRPERVHLIARSEAFHGTFGFGTTLGGIEANRAGFGPLVGGGSLVAHDSLSALEAEILRLGPERVAAFFCEPVMGAGGVRLPSDGYLEAAAELCREHGILFVADEVICAFGRLGAWFGSERWGLRPDMIVFAKGVTSGYLPLGGVIVSGEVADPLWADPTGLGFRHGTTYAGHPTCCAAALENLRILEEERLLERSRDLEAQLAAQLAPLRDHRLVGDVRAGTGFMAAVELAPEVLAGRPDAVVRLQHLARAEGVLLRPLLTSVAMSPPLVCEPADVELIGAAIATALDRLADEL